MLSKLTTSQHGARVNQQPPTQHPLEVRYDSVLDEPQLSLCVSGYGAYIHCTTQSCPVLVERHQAKEEKLKRRETQEYDRQHCSQITTVEIHPIHSPSSPHMAAERKNAS